jgi:hypothetical protein
MVLPQSAMDKGGPGVIDFQDALRGPIGYDLVSLLKDCYISWSRERVERWVKGYRRVLGTLGANVGDSEYQFLRWFDLVGVQRHIKVLGIFCRLWYRDGKSGYLGDLPLVFEYVRDACRRYPELVEFGRWLDMHIAPLFEPALVREQARAIAKAAAKAAAKRKRTAKKKKRPVRKKKRIVRKKRVTAKRAKKVVAKRAKKVVAKRAKKTALKKRKKPVRLRRTAKRVPKRTAKRPAKRLAKRLTRRRPK